MSYEALAKVILIGPSETGKSNLLLRITDDRFIKEHELTIGVEFGTKSVEVDGHAIKLQIWDTAGKEEFRSITKSYYRGALVVCVAWDASKLQQINYVESWVQEAKRQASENTRFIFVRTKSDLDNTDEGASDAQIAEQIEKVKAIALRCGIDEPVILATSAKNKTGIKELADEIAEMALPLVQDKVLSLVQDQRAARVVPPSEPFFLTERLAKIKHSRKPRVTELETCFKNQHPSESDAQWLLLHLDSVEKDCSTATNIRNYLTKFKIDIDHKQRPTEGAVVELLKLLDEEERRFAPKIITLLFFASYSDRKVAERDIERKFILDVAKNIHLGKEAFEGLDQSKAPKSVSDILAKPANRIIPERK